MRIGIIGAGRIGGTLSRLFASAGHQVAISNSRGHETLEQLADTLGEHVRAMSSASAAA